MQIKSKSLSQASAKQLYIMMKDDPEYRNMLRGVDPSSIDFVDKMNGFVDLIVVTKSKSVDNITQDAAALEELREKLHVSKAMHSRLSTLISDKAQLRAMYEAAAKQAGIPIPMFSDNVDKPMMDALNAGMPRAVADAISGSKRLNGDDILTKVGESFFFGSPLKPKD